MADSKGIAYQQGRFLAVEQAKVAILDPAFTKSDVVFDVVSVWDGRFFRLDDHRRRFRESREYVRMKSPYSEDKMKQIMAECVDRAGLTEAMVYMLCTRGSYAGGGAIGDPRSCENEFIAYSHPYYWVVPRERVQTGAHLWLAETCRAPDAAINQKTKSFNRMDLTRAQFEALDAGADAPVLPSTEGFLTEGPGFNLWRQGSDPGRQPASRDYTPYCFRTLLPTGSGDGYCESDGGRSSECRRGLHLYHRRRNCPGHARQRSGDRRWQARSDFVQTS